MSIAGVTLSMRVTQFVTGKQIVSEFPENIDSKLFFTYSSLHYITCYQRVRILYMAK